MNQSSPGRVLESWKANRSARGFTMVEASVAIVVLLFAVGGLSSAVVASIETGRANREVAVAIDMTRELIEEMQATPFDELLQTYNEDPSDDPDGAGTAQGARFQMAQLSESMASTSAQQKAKVKVSNGNGNGNAYGLNNGNGNGNAYGLNNGNGNGNGNGNAYGHSSGEEEVVEYESNDDFAEYAGIQYEAMTADEELPHDTIVANLSFPLQTQDGGEQVLRESLVIPEMGMPRDLNGDGVISDDPITEFVVLPVQIEVEWIGSDGRNTLVFQTLLRD